MKKVRVNFYKVEVKYSGDIEDYDIEDLYNMAIAAQERRCDFSPDEELLIPETEARALDGLVRLGSVYPSNKLCYVEWYSEEEYDVEEA